MISEGENNQKKPDPQKEIEIQCPICGIRFKVIMHYLSIMSKRGKKILYCPDGHQLMLSSLIAADPDAPTNYGVEDAIKNVEDHFKQY